MPTSPIVKLRLQLGPQLSSLTNVGSPTGKAVCEALEAELAECLDALGVPGKPTVEIGVDDASPRSVRWFVNARECHYPDEVPRAAWSFVRGAILGGSVDDDKRNWMESIQSTGLTDTWIPEQLTAFFRLFASAVLEQRPSVLMGPEQIQAYVANLVDAGLSCDLNDVQSRLAPILRKVLDMGLSIADAQVLLPILNEGLARGRASLDVLEDLIAELTPDTVEIHSNLELIKRVSVAATDGEKLIPLMRNGLYDEMGIRFPSFRFVRSQALPDRAFAFKINAWPTLPHVGLPAKELLVNDTVDQLKLLGINGKPAINPANDNKFSTISDTNRTPAESAGLTTWSEQGYLILCLSADLRRRGARFVNTRTVERDLAMITSAFPDLVARAKDKFGVESLTQVLRNLASEEISIRNLTAVLGHLLEFDYIRCDSALIVFDDRMPTGNPKQSWIEHPQTLADFVRSRMKRYISHKQTRGTSTLIVYVLGPEIEALLASPQTQEPEISEVDRERVLAAIDQEISSLPPSSQSPALLTTIEVRSELRKLIETRFPRVPVLCYQELSPNLNIQPIARIEI